MAFKVVDKCTRRGTNAAIAMHNLNIPNAAFDHYCPEYYPVYIKDTLVGAVPNSAGICCFKTVKHAERFIKQFNDSIARRLIIIKVRGYKKVKFPPALS